MPLFTRIIVVCSILTVATAAPHAVPQAGNSCGLLKASEVQTLASTARINEGKPEPSDPLGSLLCRWEWREGQSAFSLSVINGDASRMFPGTSASLIKQGLLGAAAPGNKKNASVVAGLGEAAVAESSAPTQSMITVYVKGRMLIVTFEGPDARSKKDQVTALAKAAVSRL
jgi:hypothetical protein